MVSLLLSPTSGSARVHPPSLPLKPDVYLHRDNGGSGAGDIEDKTGDFYSYADDESDGEALALNDLSKCLYIVEPPLHVRVVPDVDL